MTKYVVANSNQWFSPNDLSPRLDRSEFVFLDKKEALNVRVLEILEPRYIFFPHWNWRVAREIYSRWECVVFHTAPLPWGRGGSPIQNLILRGHTSSPFHALRMVTELDAGPIYTTRHVSLEGNLSEIFSRLSLLVAEMIEEIIYKQPTPHPQIGEPFVFSRREPSASEILPSDTREIILDKIRMVDFGEYPKAFIDLGNLRVEFTGARLEANQLVAEARFIFG